uniref:Uncharacterized protein n=1 Tax=Lotus japonicus TaxID=34305 RepID=I3S949_LOTJA|nr:unknown [Lotus japonicus]
MFVLLSFSPLPSLRWTTFLGTTLELQVTWWAMEATSLRELTTEVHPLFPSRLTVHLSPAAVVMLLGIVAKGAILMSLPVLLLAVLMHMMTLLMKEITMSKQSQQPTTMLL